MNYECNNAYTNECIGDGHADMRHDAYGHPTAAYCDTCYNEGKYPYRKDTYYDPSTGERLDVN